MTFLKALPALVFISFTLSAQIGAKVQQEKITGLWQNSQFGYQMTLMLNADGSGEFDGESIRYTSKGITLAITIGETTTNYTYALQENSLTLSGGDLEGKVIFSRNVSQSASADQSKQTYSNTSHELIGLWSGNGETIEFKPDGKCIYLGNVLSYQVFQGNIVLTTAQGNVSFAYAVAGKQLTLTANGQKVVYNRPEGSSVAGNTNNTGEKIPMELVGKWCYMNMTSNSQTSRCITLNADGTYLYASESSRSVNTPEVYGGTSSQGGDQGTWYVQGDRIYYNSRTQGQGSYRLEKRNHPKNVNDPMIVLDGEPYVTATLRSPWR